MTAATGPVPVIMDVDTGIDDAMSLLFAVRHPGIDLRAVTCVAGNTGVEQVTANTRYVLDAAGAADIPVARGAAHPLLVPPADASHVHGPDGLGGFSRPSDRRLSPLPAVELLRRELMAAVGTGEKITLVPSAPLTNIALLLRTHPEVAAGIERILFMGGSATVGNATAAAEFNIWHDPEAAAVALTAAGELDIPVTMYGLDVFNDVVITRDEAAQLRAHLDPGAQLAGSLIDFACDTLRFRRRHHRRCRHGMRGGRPGRTHHPDVAGAGRTRQRTGPRADPRRPTHLDRRPEGGSTPGQADDGRRGDGCRRPAVRGSVAGHRRWLKVSQGRRCPRSTATAPPR